MELFFRIYKINSIKMRAKFVYENLIQALDEAEKIDPEKLKKEIIEYYKNPRLSDIDYTDSLELEWDPTYKFYWAWVKPYSNTQVFKNKTGLSETHAQKNFILASNTLKEKDPAGWKEHEIGHILGYRKGYYNKVGNIINPKEVYGLKNYPNVWSEFIPFTRQMKYLQKNKNSAQNIIRFMMKDYEQSNAHKGNIEELKQIEELFIKLYNKYVDKTVQLQNKYNKDAS